MKNLVLHEFSRIYETYADGPLCWLSRRLTTVPLNVQTNNDRDGRQLDPARRRPRTIDDPAAFERVGLDRALEAGWLECVDVKRDLRHFSTTLSSITTANTSQGGAQGPQRDKTSRGREVLVLVHTEITLQVITALIIFSLFPSPSFFHFSIIIVVPDWDRTSH